MRFDLDDEQRELQEMARRFAVDQLEQRREEVIRGGSGFDERLWQRLAAEVGIIGLNVPEQHGGSGASAVEMVIALEELGRVCAPLPAVTTCLAAALLTRAEGPTVAPTLKGIAEGQIRVGMSTRWAEPAAVVEDDDAGQLRLTAEQILAPSAQNLTHLIVAAEVAGEAGLFLVDLDGSGVTIDGVDSLDLTQPIGRITLSDTAADRLTSNDDLVRLARSIGAVFIAADSVGVARWCLDTAVSWAREREQFGRPIGTHQALKHMCANAMVEIETAAALVYYAAFALASDHEDADLHASLAKQQATDAADLAASQAIQILGGIGFTWEHHAHLYLRRSKANAALCGDRDYHLGRVADTICAPYETKAGAR